MPAKSEPHMTEEAPRARALAMWPEFWIPVSCVCGVVVGGGGTREEEVG